MIEATTIETAPARTYTIRAPGLDPITLVLQDLSPSQGRIIFGCYGQFWSGYWGAMGRELSGEPSTVSQFFVSCDNDYLAGCVQRANVTSRRAEKDERAYLNRILNAVKAGIAVLPLETL